MAVERGVGLTLRDLATGDVVDVRERTASQTAHDGERYCGRVVPDGATHQIVGGMFSVRTGDEQAVLDLCDRADPYEVCAWAGALASLDLQKLDPPTLGHILREAMAATGIAGASLPDRMAAVSEVLNHLPPPLRERLLVHLELRMVHAVDGAAALVAHAERDEAARHLLEVEGEVLAAHHRRQLLDALRADDLFPGLPRQLPALRIVHGRGVAAAGKLDLRLTPACGGDQRRDLPDPRLKRLQAVRR